MHALTIILKLLAKLLLIAGILFVSTQAFAKKVYVDGLPFDSLADAVPSIEDKSTIYLEKGVYRKGAYISKSDISIIGEPGVVFDGAFVDGKAALVLTGNNILVESIECKNIKVPDGNGACIRFEGQNITIRDLYAHDSQSGVMTGWTKGTVNIEFSRFERLGNRNGYSHAMYIIADELNVRYSSILSTKKQGSGIKSRSRKVSVENSIIASQASVDSRLIDMAEYGELIVKDSILQQGPNSSNSQLIAYGLENKAKRFKTNRIELRNNLIFYDRNINVLVSKRLDDEFLSRGNVFVGDLNHPKQMVPGNAWYLSRQEARVKPFPYLPKIEDRQLVINQIRAIGNRENF